MLTATVSLPLPRPNDKDVEIQTAERSEGGFQYAAESEVISSEGQFTLNIYTTVRTTSDTVYRSGTFLY